MPGGLLQLVAYGQANIILNGNPSKTFFKAVYKPYTPFGMQRFRLDYDGLRALSFDTSVEMDFKIPRYAELLWDTYIVVNLPDIWSPIYYRPDVSGNYLPYRFQWVRDLGFTMIRQVSIYSGGSTLAQYSGEWMANAMRRDEIAKQGLMRRMIGYPLDEELTDPAAYAGGHYPNAVWNDQCATTGIEPSIRGRQLYIPLMAWFCFSPKTALPLIALQYQEVHIRIEFRPIRELFTILDVEQIENTLICPAVSAPVSDPNVLPILNLERKAPNAASVTDQLWKFIQPPTGLPTTAVENSSQYLNRRNDWNADVHLIGTYIFLGGEERRTMAAKSHEFLVKTQYEWDFLNVTGSQRVDLPSRDMVSSYMWRFRRSDVNLRNEWNNYQNYAWEDVVPHPPVVWDTSMTPPPPAGSAIINPLDIFVTGCRNIENRKNILLSLAILCGQEYRENVLAAGVYDWIEKWFRTTGIAKDGLYCYNFCINTSRLMYQPSGAQNTNKWQYITFEFNTIEPPRNPCTDTNSVDVLCDPSGAIIGVRKDVWRLNKYNFDLRVFEERFNMIEVVSGRIGLLFAR